MSSGYTVLGSTAFDFPEFRPGLLWRGGDLQTIRNTITWDSPVFPAHRQSRMRLPMNDGTGDYLLGLLDKPEQDQSLPLLILVHGLTGCEASRNIMTSAAHFVDEGFPTLRLNLRGAGPSLGSCTEHYHAGRSEDLVMVLNELPDELKTYGVAIVGVSLGGNTVLKMVGEGSHTEDVIACASICAPIDLKMAQLRIMETRNRLYHRYLINRMKKDALENAEKSQSEQVQAVLKNVRTVYDYDDLIVAPNNGFDGAEDYYRRSSAKTVLAGVAIPTLCVHAATDPWIPLTMYTEQAWPEESNRTLVICDDGGHVGFHQKNSPVPWHNQCVSAFLKSVIAGR
jgi:predicted alpha/beta-fold hydrolase